jgi:peroxiredoxin
MSKKGQLVPAAFVAHLVNGALQAVQFQELAAGKHMIAVGVPGAFTPVCTQDHIPDFVNSAPRLKASGFDRIICIAPNDPWTVREWAERLDPERRIEFYSDGNLSLAHGLDAAVVDYANFLGETSSRYLLIARNGVIEKLTIEGSHLCLTCTRAQDVVLA